MAQVFSRSADFWLRAVLVGVAALVVLPLAWAVGVNQFDLDRRLSLADPAAAAPFQPVPFNHRQHVGEIGLDCRYCHDGVEVAPHAGFPAVEVCMTCHYMVADRPPVPWAIEWRRVAPLADFTYFDHSIHVQKGVGCATCHGRIDLMPKTYQAIEWEMPFCLDCHEDPGPRLRPPDAVFDMAWEPPADRATLGRALIAAHDIDVGNLSHCYVCHR